MSTASSAPVQDLIATIGALRQTNPELAIFFRNQQRFLHLYALARRQEVTATYITDLLQALDPERTFGPRTYYNLRREMQEAGWIEMAAQTPGRAENPHRIKPERHQAFVEAVIEAGLVERPVVLNKYRLFDIGLRFAGLAAQARQEPTVLMRLREELEHLRGQDGEQIFYPGFATYRLASELLELAVAPVKLDETEKTRDEHGVLWVTRIWRGLVSQASPPPQYAPTLGGIHREHKLGLTTSRDRGAVTLPRPQATALLIELAPDASGRPRLSASVLGGSLEGAELRYAFAGQRGHCVLLPVVAPGNGRGRCEGEAQLVEPENPMAAVSTLSLALVRPGLPAGVLSIAVHRTEGQPRFKVSVSSCGTGLIGVKLECLVGTARGAAPVPPEAEDHWQTEIDLPHPMGPPPLRFALWIAADPKES